MKTNTTMDLREKEIINLCNGARLGYPCDFEFDICDGKIISLIIPGEKGLFGGCKTQDIIIPWCKIECFGEDTILVKLEAHECCKFSEKKKKREFI